jgi:hypothetical protein
MREVSPVLRNNLVRVGLVIRHETETAPRGGRSPGAVYFLVSTQQANEGAGH